MVDTGRLEVYAFVYRWREEAKCPICFSNSHRVVLGGVLCVNSDWVSENSWMMSCQGRAARGRWQNVGAKLHFGCDPRCYFTEFLLH